MSFKSMLGAVLLGAMLTEVNSQQLFKLVPVGPNNYGDLNPYGNQGGIAFGNGNGNGVPGYFVGQQLNGNKNNLGSQAFLQNGGKNYVNGIGNLNYGLNNQIDGHYNQAHGMGNYVGGMFNGVRGFNNKIRGKNNLVDGAGNDVQ